jgi:copper(I)-binding protein
VRILLTAAALLLAAHAPGATGADTGNVVIEDAWARASIGGAPTSVAYMTIEVAGEEADRLVGAETPVAQSVVLHAHTMADGIARMRPVAEIEVEPGAPTVLAPGGLHLMLIGLEHELEEGTRLPLTLVFERAGRVELEIPVRGIAGARPHGGHRQHGHGGTN